MSLESALFELTTGDAAVGAIVGDRVRPMIAAQGEARPFVAYAIRKDPTFDTLSDGPSAYRSAEIELAVYAERAMTVADLCDKLQALLDGYGETVGGVEFAPILYQSETDIEEVENEGEEKPVYLRVQTYRALYKVT